MPTLDRLFSLTAHKTTPRRELISGLTTFSAMAYILAVNPAILSTTGMDREALVTVTALAAAIGCFLMAALTNYPIALAPAMGTNAYFAFVIVAGAGIPWQAALSLTFWNGIIFLLLSVTGFRKALAESLPESIKIGIQCGIGFFIAFIGLKNVGIIVASDATLVTIGNMVTPAAILTVLGLILMAFLTLRRIPGAILIGVIAIALAGIFIPETNGGKLTAVPAAIVATPHGIGSLFLQLDWWYPFREFSTAWTLVLTLLILDLFDSLGAFVGLAQRAKLLDAAGKMPKMGRALSADAGATITGALLGTSTVTTYIESAAGIETGGRTGLTAVVTGFCFLLAIAFAPLFTVIPAVATAPALIMVGVFMTQGLKHLDFDNINAVAPAFVTMLLIPLTFSITEGIGLGILVYVGLMAVQRRFKEIPVLTWIVALLFLSYYLTH